MTDYTGAYAIPIPTPKLQHSFRLVCDLEPLLSLGEGAGGAGQHNWISFSGGSWSGTFGKGEIVPGGQDSQYIQSASHPSAPLAAKLSTRYLIKTHEDDGSAPTFIQISTRGWRTGPKEVLQRLSDAARVGSTVVLPSPEEYSFRLFIEMEVDAKSKYGHLNTAMFVGSGLRNGKQVIYDAYQVM